MENMGKENELVEDDSVDQNSRNIVVYKYGKTVLTVAAFLACVSLYVLVSIHRYIA